MSATRIETDKFIIDWAIPDRVILIDYQDSIDKSDLTIIADGLRKFHQAGNSPIHVISDNRQMGAVNADLSNMREAFSIMRQDGWGWMILVGTDQLITFFARVVANVFGLNIRNVNSPEEALESLRRLDQTLSGASE